MIKIEVATDGFLLEQMEPADMSLLNDLVGIKLIVPSDLRYVRKVLYKGKEEVFLLRLNEDSPPRAIIVGYIKHNVINISLIEVHEALKETLLDILSLNGENVRRVLHGR